MYLFIQLASFKILFSSSKIFRRLLQYLGGPAPPSPEWLGALEDVSYNLGPEMRAEYANWTVRMETHNVFGTRRQANVIGYIRGSVEPDRYVLLTNHRDAWGRGAIDPASGTAQVSMLFAI